MAVERRNPLPAGVYSIDLPNKLVPGFTSWRRSHGPAVRVVKTNDNGAFSWLLFTVSSPVPWADSKVYGFPSIAKAADERPQAFEPTKDVSDRIADGLPSPETLTSLLWIVGIGFGLWTAVQFVKAHSEGQK